MDLDNNTTNNNNNQQHQQQQHQQPLDQNPPHSNEQQQQQQQTSKQQQQPIQTNTNNQQKVKANPTFDWLANFPISEDMKDKSQLQTEFSRKIFNFLKSYLYIFYSRKEIKFKTSKQKALKASFYYIICKILQNRSTNYRKHFILTYFV